jgi:hypothetical protein
MVAAAYIAHGCCKSSRGCAGWGSAISAAKGVVLKLQVLLTAAAVGQQSVAAASLHSSILVQPALKRTLLNFC